ncbi:prephenate dehydratase [Kribbella antibiotica]|uniref:prephenate dehydratase n=1 Tax=Kribbella antibiotica TaxID=190195 RepID=UPI001404405B|nr:prephenate dehydratase domain-containing protein [Kribbella antibiotica]
MRRNSTHVDHADTWPAAPRKLVAIQGIEGSFHHQAACELLTEPFTIMPCTTFRQVFDAVGSGRAHSAVVAVENSVYGSINAVHRLLQTATVQVQAETCLNVDQYLITAGSLSLESITDVISQTPALEQCETWLGAHLPHARLVEGDDTAMSVRDVVARSDIRWAAVGGEHAAKRYGGTIVAGPINDAPNNRTRFFLIDNSPVAASMAGKTSVIVSTGPNSGSLQHSLSVFDVPGVNVSRLDSHPIPGSAWRYSLYIDFESSNTSGLGARIIDSLRAQMYAVTVLGSYPPSEIHRLDEDEVSVGQNAARSSVHTATRLPPLESHQ